MAAGLVDLPQQIQRFPLSLPVPVFHLASISDHAFARKLHFGGEFDGCAVVGWQCELWLPGCC